MIARARSVWGLAGLSVAALAICACTATTDSLGYDDSESKVLLPLKPPASYPNPFRDLLGETDAAITAKITNVFNTLFHGSAAQAIYVAVGDDQAYIEDTFHDNEIRTEGIGLGMMICVELNKQDEFDKLWTYAKQMVELGSGPNAGYFPSYCDAADGTTTSCLDPYGFEQFVTALIFANDRWKTTGTTIDYAADALALFHTLRHKQDDNGGVVEGVTNMFDATTNLPLDVPDVSAAGVTRPSLVMPGYEALWAEADADPNWTAAAESGRAFWQAAANATTGFMPVRADFDGTPVPGWDTFQPEGYRAQINVVIDQIWSGGDAWNVTESNQLLAFFSGQGINTYGKSFSLDGTTVLDPSHEPSLVVANGIAAVASTNGDRSGYVSAVWNMDIPTGDARYYSGILELVGLLILSGQFQVY
ncbi:MAG TPA: glycosyl hydrolase family 8 [Polyangia bacterium]|jgi:oligosaccharide reducing-end xylanase|nr:glycosyl hydrolase family 8 [Polyangia bacterium]